MDTLHKGDNDYDDDDDDDNDNNHYDDDNDDNNNNNNCVMTESADEMFVESAFILLIRMVLMDVKFE